MDAFAVSIGLGSKETRGLGLKVGLFYGGFQALMPFIGYLGGKGVLGWVDDYARWIAFGLLALIGAKMIYEGMQEGIEEDIAGVANKMMLLLAIATSIDAMAAASPDAARRQCLAGLPDHRRDDFRIQLVGVEIGKRSGTWLESRAGIFGGVVLI